MLCWIMHLPEDKRRVGTTGVTFHNNALEVLQETRTTVGRGVSRTAVKVFRAANEEQGQNLALTGLFVPNSLDRVWRETTPRDRSVRGGLGTSPM